MEILMSFKNFWHFFGGVQHHTMAGHLLLSTPKCITIILFLLKFFSAFFFFFFKFCFQMMFFVCLIVHNLWPLTFPFIGLLAFRLMPARAWRVVGGSALAVKKTIKTDWHQHMWAFTPQTWLHVSWVEQLCQWASPQSKKTELSALGAFHWGSCH